MARPSLCAHFGLIAESWECGAYHSEPARLGVGVQDREFNSGLVAQGGRRMRARVLGLATEPVPLLSESQRVTVRGGG